MKINSDSRKENRSQSKFSNKNINFNQILDKIFEAIKNLISNINGNSSSSQLNITSSIAVNKEKFHDESAHPYGIFALQAIENFDQKTNNQNTNIAFKNSQEILDLTNPINENPEKNINKKNTDSKGKIPSAEMQMDDSTISSKKSNNLKNH